MNNSLEEKVGYLTAKMEEQGHDLRAVVLKVDYLSELVQKKFTTAETILKSVRFIWITIIAILTLQFADIKEWWLYFFSK